MPRGSTGAVLPPSSSDELRDAGQAARECLEHGAVGLSEAERVEVLDRTRPVDLEQKAARVHAVATARRGLLDDRDRRALVVGGDRGAGAGGAEPGDEDVDFVGQAHAGAPLMIRNGSEPSQPAAASRTIA